MARQSEGALQRIIQALLGRAGWHGGFRPGERRHKARAGKYTGEQLREIRARKGVGRRKGYPVWEGGVPHGWKAYPALLAAIWDKESPNLYEWTMKPRKAVR
jgi:hypothetical protein